jgi:hypothetical protein
MMSGIPALLALTAASVAAFGLALVYTYTSSVHSGDARVRGFLSPS